MKHAEQINPLSKRVMNDIIESYESAKRDPKV